MISRGRTGTERDFRERGGGGATGCGGICCGIKWGSERYQKENYGHCPEK